MNGDDIMDLFTGCWEGGLFLMAGRSSGGFSGPVPIRDKSGRVLRIGRYYDNDARKYTNVEGAKFPDLHLIAADAVDWDADGDLDLVQGTNEGLILLRLNEGSAKDPAFATESVQIVVAGGEPMNVPGGKSMPVTADWDGDGCWDILSGSGSGGVVWFRNTGSRGKPVFAPVQVLVTSSKGGKQAEEPTWPGDRTQVAVTDFDGDGDTDLLVGDRYNQRNKDGDTSTRHGWIWLFRRNGP